MWQKRKSDYFPQFERNTENAEDSFDPKSGVYSNLQYLPILRPLPELNQNP